MITSYLVTKLDGSKASEYYGGCHEHAAQIYMLAHTCCYCRVTRTDQPEPQHDGMYAATVSGSARLVIPGDIEYVA